MQISFYPGGFVEGRNHHGDGKTLFFFIYCLGYDGNLEMFSKKTYTWPVPAKYAMELSQGSRDDLGLQPGDVIIARERWGDLDDLL